jgi:uncharacterized protein YraI
MAALVAGIVLPGAAFAASLAYTTADLNIRTGPSASYQRFDTIPEGGQVTVHGCLSGYNWCDVSWSGERGWVSGAYLAYAGERYVRQPIPSIGLSIGLPVIGFSPEVYHRRHYVGRSWYRDRYLGRHERPFDRRDHRDVRRDHRDWRQHGFDRRHPDLRHDRRFGGDQRRDPRQDRSHIRRERHENRHEARQHGRPHKPVLREAQKDSHHGRRD